MSSPLVSMLCVVVSVAACRGSDDGIVGAAAAGGVEPAVVLADVEPSNLDDDETVELLPTFAVLRDGAWQVPIDAWVYEPEEDSLSRAAVVGLLGEAVELPTNVADDELVRQRMRSFVVDNERGKILGVRRGAHGTRVGPTGPNGRANGVLALPVGDPATKGEGNPPWVELEVVMPSGDSRRFSAWAQLLPDEGVSVISDIDDTIKITEVNDRKKMLENTFLRRFEAVPGMAQAYRRWADEGVAFSYLSASPLPLGAALMEFGAREGFPRGTLNLRPFRWKDGTAIDLLEPSESYKHAAIEVIIGSFEQRRFVLVGDTGERDPEIYAAVARRHPGRIDAVYLRDPIAGGTPGIDARLDAVFEGLPRSLWHVIADGSQLPERL